MPRSSTSTVTTRSTSTTFRCRYVSGAAHVADDESEAVGWFPVDDLPDMAPAVRERITTALHHDRTVRLAD